MLFLFCDKVTEKNDINPYNEFYIHARRVYMIKRKAKVLKDECVACGCCKKVCPRDAISIKKGMYSQINEALCVGCKKCILVCPADVIELIEMEV